ncbi:MAG: UDP-3-O-acyl-N-acetylglucosamine deacetylase [Phycisphaerales bacterium]|nr:UDP-3-O-acyl-N-acetylglucosamine deacetylase [Phycisphaerales bacterium]
MMRRARPRGPIAGRGVSLFGGRPTSFAIRPAEFGAGVRFRRVDLAGRPEIPAHIAALSNAPVHPVFTHAPARCTTLEAGDARVSVTEHVLAALAGMGITDAEIEVDGPEMPIFDGSAGIFAAQLRAMGREEGADLTPVTLRNEVRVRDGEAEIMATPRSTPGCSYRYELDYGAHPAIPAQSAAWTGPGPDTFAREVAPARTFCLEEDARQMLGAGLFGHLEPGDMLVLGRFGPIDNELRYDDEPARHKLLDLVGDLALAGPIQCDIVARRSGHALNHRMARALAGAG